MLRDMNTRPPRRRVFGMFPGLGDHYVNMARGLYDGEPGFRQIVDRCCELLVPEVGLDLRTVIYSVDGPASGPVSSSSPPSAGLDLRRMFGRGDAEPSAAAQRLNQTELTQPALFVIEYALAMLWQSRQLPLDAVIGYSLGEYVAGCLAGVLSLEDSLKLVARRAQLISRLPRGAMLAVPVAEAQLVPLLGEHLSICAVNGPEVCVIGGPPEPIDQLQQQLRRAGTVSRRVQTSHAFHTSMMAPIAQEVTRLAATFARRPPQIPLISNVTGAPLSAAQAADPGYYAEHLCRPVRFAEGIRALWQQPDAVFVELGPGQTLTSLAQQNAPPQGGQDGLVVYTLRHAYDEQPDAVVLAAATARLQAAGVLPAPAGDTAKVAPATAATFREPQSEVERALAAIWKELLRLPRVGLDDHFFERGGNSLLAARVLVRVRKRFPIDLRLRQLYLAPTLESFAAVVAGLSAARSGTAATSAGAAAAVSSSQAAASHRLIPFVLPDGTEIVHVSEAESRHFYHDIFEQRSYLKHGIRIPDGGCVFDVGANIGLFTLFAAREARDVKIYSFEPAPPLFAHLSHNVHSHQVKARLFNVGLSDHERMAEFTFYPNSSGMSSFYADLAEEKDVLRAIVKNQGDSGLPQGEALHDLAPTEELLDARFSSQTLSCQLRRLADVIAETQVACIDLLKIDVQKCEHEVLAGLQDGDWPKIQQIAIEVHDIDGRLAQLSALLGQKGYRVIAEQDPLYAGTNIHNLYALRSQSAATGR